MDDGGSRPNGDARQHASIVDPGARPGMATRGGYLLASLILIALYPMLPASGRDTVLLLASLSAIPAVLVGFRRIPPGHLQPWALLLAALVVINVANVLALFPGHIAADISSLVNAAGNVVVLAAVLVLMARQGSGIPGRIIDTTIVAFAVGGLLWDVVLVPNLVTAYQTEPQRLALCVIVFSLCGVLGALVQLVIMRPVGALRPTLIALAFSLVANIVLAVTTEPALNTAAAMMFMGAYTGVALFGLDRTAVQLVTPAPHRPDTLSTGRLVFLGVAVAVVPVVVGARQLAGGLRDGLVLVISGATITTLVMARIAQLSAQRDRAERALRHEATHDSLTGLPNRKEFLARIGTALAAGDECAIVFCDLDRFKAVNDQFGHAYGDLLLIEVAKRLRSCIRADDLVSRFGGDEFVILFRDASTDDVRAARQRINEALARPVLLSGERVTIGATTGTAHATDGADPERLIAQADRAMYAAKTNGMTDRGQ